MKFLEKKLAKAGINIDLSDQLYTSASPNDENANEKAKENENDTTLNRLLNETINTDESDDDDYEPTPKDMQKAMADTKKIAKKNKIDTANPTSNQKAKKIDKNKKAVEPATNQKQKKRKADSNEMPLQQLQEQPLKKKKIKAVVEKTKAVTTPRAQKIRKNYVTPPTPEPTPKKKKNKNKLNIENVPAVPVKAKKTKKNSVTADANVNVKKATISKVAKSKQINSAPIQTKSLKKGPNKKK